MTVPGAVCKDFAESSHLEWLQTNHTGAFAMGTASGVNTRRYHGLLIATLNPPADRYSIFPRVEEVVEWAGETLALGAAQYPGVVTPCGYELLEEFSAAPLPTWIYRHQALRLTKTLRLIDGEQSVAIAYCANAPCTLEVRLFISFRDYHSLMKQNASIHVAVDEKPGYLCVQPYSSLPALRFYHDAESFRDDGVWFLNHEYLRELERGLDFREDLYSPGILHFALQPEQAVHLVATLEDRAPVTAVSATNELSGLTLALDQFRVQRADGRPTLMAGYPWFTDWSRDTLISLPALLATGFPSQETKAILRFLLEERRQGILPNRFSDRQSAPEYNTADASLWFFVAAHKYVEQTNDLAFLEETLFPAALDIIDWHRKGTFYGVHVDLVDHLLAAGEPGTQLTWMDAKIGDHVMTPRIGKPVEINALWFNALRITGHWAEMLNKQEFASSLSSDADLVAQSFGKKFWNADRQCLYDVLTASGPDASLRPNQLFALSLPFPLLDRQRGKSIVQIVKQQLLTPVGLRTLEPGDKNYRPRFDGDMASRDSAYHQGTVWPWLIGPFIAAYLYAFDRQPEAMVECKRIIDSLLGLANHYCLGSIGEVYDAEPPHRPGGCPAQLWSVAQVALALKSLEPG